MNHLPKAPYFNKQWCPVILMIAIICSLPVSVYAKPGSTFSMKPQLSNTWAEMTIRADHYQLAAASSFSNRTVEISPVQEAINIPLNPDKNVYTYPKGRLLGKYSLLARDTGYLLIPATVVLGLLYIAPESVSNWDEEDKDNSLGELGDKWWDNVSNGPVWDEDDWWLNWIGHPYWGATYYVHSRHYAYSRIESFWYSFFLSNVLYEYGLEAFAEEPSIQDLIATPVGGWLIGEFIFLPVEAKIIANDNKVLGSRVLGKTLRFLIDPMGSIIRPLRRFKQRISGKSMSQEVSETESDFLVLYPFVGENRAGLQIAFSF
jgi:hypothetical protein